MVKKNISDESKIILQKIIEGKIFLIRGKKVMLDRHLAELYGVQTKVFNQAVQRNILRFPDDDFMFQLTKEELDNWRSQIVTSNKDKMGLRRRPYVFTEQGVAMLSGVLNSDRAIMVNIQIIKAFVKMRKVLLLANTDIDIREKIARLEKEYEKHDQEIKAVFNFINKLFGPMEDQPEKPKKIGF